MDWRKKKREDGHRDKLIWLSPAGLTALDRLRVGNRLSTDEIINAALVQASTTGLALAENNQVMPTDQLAEVTATLANVTDAIAELTARVAQIEAETVAPEVAVEVEAAVAAEAEVETPAVAVDAQDTGPAAEKPPKDAPQTARPGKGSDLVTIAAAVAERRAREGDNFKRAALWRELKAAGVNVHATPENFSTAVAKILAQT